MNNVELFLLCVMNLYIWNNFVYQNQYSAKLGNNTNFITLSKGYFVTPSHEEVTKFQITYPKCDHLHIRARRPNFGTWANSIAPDEEP